MGSLFSGAGLGDLGWMMAGFDIRWQVEIDDYCRKVLDSRFPDTRKYGDIKEVKGEELEPVDIVAGGFPCQPFSFAGKRRGPKDDRNLWPEMSRIISEVKPAWVVAENVLGVVGYVESVVLPDLETQGYETLPPLVFEAHALGAPHPRARVWIIAYHDGRRLNAEKLSIRQGRQIETKAFFDWRGSADADDNGQRLEECRKHQPDEKRHIGIELCGTPTANIVEFGRIGRLPKSRKEARRWTYAETTGRSPWCCQPGICRVVHGRAGGVDRLKALGNGQVVACTAFLGQKIMEYKSQ